MVSHFTEELLNFLNRSTGEDSGILPPPMVVKIARHSSALTLLNMSGSRPGSGVFPKEFWPWIQARRKSPGGAFVIGNAADVLAKRASPKSGRMTRRVVRRSQD